jgi:putative spermidine/putrescine transport system ATP-binding protein
MRMGFLELEGVRKEFPGHIAVQHFDLDVPKGAFVSFLGPSGCGKTTTLRMIAGFELPTAGAIRIDGQDISRTSPHARNVGMVFQSYALFPNMTVADNIGFGLRVRHVGKDGIRRKVAEMLDLIHLAGKGGQYPYELSGGMQQRVALARALAIEPRVLLLDEPLSALDAKIRVALRQEIRSIQRQLGITTVYVTHDQEEALSLSDTIVVMSEGRVEQIGSPAEVYGAPATPFVARFVGQLSVLTGRVVDTATGRVAIGRQELDLGRPLEGHVNGTSVTLSIRPEAIEIATPAGARPRLTGTIRDIQFLGPVIRTRLDLDGDGGVLLFDVFNRPGMVPPEPGQAVTVAIPADSVLVVAAGAVLPGPLVEDEEAG